MPKTNSKVFCAKKIICQENYSSMTHLPTLKTFNSNKFFLKLIYWYIFNGYWFVWNIGFITWDLVREFITCCQAWWVIFFKRFIHRTCRFLCQLIFSEHVSVIFSHVSLLFQITINTKYFWKKYKVLLLFNQLYTYSFNEIFIFQIFQKRHESINRIPSNLCLYRLSIFLVLFIKENIVTLF